MSRGGVARGAVRIDPGWAGGYAALVLSVLIAAVVAAHAQPAPPTPLRNLVEDQVVAKIGSCKGDYTLTMASRTEPLYPEFTLRFKTDSSRLGPEAGKPAWLPAGMRGDRAQVIFASVEDLKRFLVEPC